MTDRQKVVFIDGVGAGRCGIESCRDGVQWIMVGDRVYWPLSDADAQRLQSACCGNGSFDGPTSSAGDCVPKTEREQRDEALLRQALEFCELCWRDVALNDYALERLDQTITALTQALAATEPEVMQDGGPPCKRDPRAPHGFLRDTSHAAGRYVCECEFWEPPATTEPLIVKGAMTGMVDAQVRDLWPTKKEQATTERKLVATPDHNGALVPASPADMQTFGPSHNQITHWARINLPAIDAAKKDPS